jgi:hypothetical protein
VKGNLDEIDDKRTLLIGGITKEVSLSRILAAFESPTKRGIKNFDVVNIL